MPATVDAASRASATSVVPSTRGQAPAAAREQRLAGIEAEEGAARQTGQRGEQQIEAAAAAE